MLLERGVQKGEEVLAESPAARAEEVPGALAHRPARPVGSAGAREIMIPAGPRPTTPFRGTPSGPAEGVEGMDPGGKTARRLAYHPRP